MQTLIKIALLSGLLSLVGVGYLIYSVLATKDSAIVTSVVNEEKVEKQDEVIQEEPEKETIVEKTIEPPAEPEEVFIKKPSTVVMRRTSYGLPGYSMVKQVMLSFPTIKRQVQRQLEQQRKMEEEERRLLEEQEKSFFMDVEPPVAAPEKTPEPEPEKETPKKEEPKPTAPVSSISKPVVPLPKEVERALVEEANKNNNNVDKKRETILSGGRPPVREMRKRFDGTLSDRQLADVLNDIFGAKGENDSDAQCVHIKSLPETEVTAKQLSSYLLNKGFVMAGRSEANPKDRGIRVDASGRCIVVTIGKIE